MENIENILEWVGLSENESKIYLTLLKLWKSWVTEISRKSWIKRTTIYPYITSLLEKNLIKRTVKWKRTFFTTEDPKNIIDNLEDKKKRFLKKLPILEWLYKENSPNPNLEFYEGKNALMNLYKKIWLSWLTVYTFFSPEEFYKHFRESYGNSSSLHSISQKAAQTLVKCRQTVASLINVQRDEIFFTSSGTEADNLALLGVAYKNESRGNHIITSAIEHHAVDITCKQLEKRGFKVTFLPVDKSGLINLKELEEKITDKTILISIMFANNEIGTIEPIKEIGKIAKNRDIIFHTDAVQAFGKVPIDVNEMNIDLLSATAHKLYGPKGVGMLYIRNKGIRDGWGKIIEPIMYGGGHERDMRPSTVNIPGIAGFAKAVEIAKDEMPKERERETKLRDKIIRTVLNNIED